MSKKNILVFPCGSEVALEIYRSLEYSTYFNLIGGNSVDDHGKFVFKNYIGNIPFVTDKNFIEEAVLQKENLYLLLEIMQCLTIIFKTITYKIFFNRKNKYENECYNNLVLNTFKLISQIFLLISNLNLMISNLMICSTRTKNLCCALEIMIKKQGM